MIEPVVRKTYYSIGEVGRLTGLQPHVLRFWETQFDVVSPQKNRGTRVYRTRDIEAVLLVRHLLYDRQFTIKGARQEIQSMRDAGTLVDEARRTAEPGVLAAMRGELERLREELTLPDEEGADGG